MAKTKSNKARFTICFLLYGSKSVPDKVPKKVYVYVLFGGDKKKSSSDSNSDDDAQNPAVKNGETACSGDECLVVAAMVVVAPPMAIYLQPQRLAERLADLTEEQRVHVTAALLPPHDEALLVNNFIIPVTRRIGNCLNPKLWLNDEIINYYRVGQATVRGTKS